MPDVHPGRRAVVQAGRPGRRLERGRVGLVGVEVAQLLGELVAQLAAGQRQRPVRQAGAAEGGDAVVALDGDLLAGLPGAASPPCSSGRRRRAPRARCRAGPAASRAAGPRSGRRRGARPTADDHRRRARCRARWRSASATAWSGSRPGRCRPARSPRPAAAARRPGRRPGPTSVIRRSATTPSGSLAIASGGTSCHQVTTGTSGASSGITTDSAWWVSRPCIRITTASHGPSRPPTTISASNLDSDGPESGGGDQPRTTMISRHGCAAAAVAAAVSASRTRFSSTATIRVSASPLATPPALRRSADERLDHLVPVVSHSAIMVPPIRSLARARWLVASMQLQVGRRGRASRRRPADPTRRPGR